MRAAAQAIARGWISRHWVAGDACKQSGDDRDRRRGQRPGQLRRDRAATKDLDYPEAREFISAYATRYGGAAREHLTIIGRRSFHVIALRDRADPLGRSGVLAQYLHASLKNLNGLTGPILASTRRATGLGTIHLAYRIDERGSSSSTPGSRGSRWRRASLVEH